MKIGEIEMKVWRKDITDMIDMMFIHNGNRYSIRYTSYNVQKDQNIIRNMLSSLQFLE